MTDRSTPFDIFRIEQEIRARNPAVVFASPRTLRRVIRAERGLPGFWPRIPHRDIVVIAARRLAEIAADFWAFPADLPATIMLIARPDADRFQAVGLEPLLRAYWRLVFHALLDARLAALDAADRRTISAAISAELRAEARGVLTQELAITGEATDDEVDAEFVATFLDLRAFAPDSIHAWFPSIEDPDTFADAVGPPIGAGEIFATSRPPGLPESDDPAAQPAGLPANAGPADRLRPWVRVSAATLRRRAERSAARGNMVRALLDEFRAEAEGAGETGDRTAARADLVAGFARRFAAAAGLDAEAVPDLTALVRALLAASGGSAWSAPARLLFDMQKVCVDAERESYRTRLVAWLATAGRTALTKPLPCQRLVSIHRHAVKAAARLARLGPAAGLPAAGVERLAAAVASTARAARGSLQPRVEAAIRGAGLVPGCLVEEAAFDTLVDELLDGIVDRGFISFGDLRDAVSRNQLKLPDLAGVGEWLGGDQLLRADQALGIALDGAYRPAPAYLAGLQRLSAPFFGVGAGRLLTTHLLLPFGAAWILLRGVEHVVEPISEYSLGEVWHLYTPWRMLAIGGLLWALIHVPAVRVGLRAALRLAGAAIYELAVGLPARLLRLPAFAAFLRSLPVTWFRRHLAGPLVVTFAAWLCLPHHGGTISRSTPWLPPLVFAVATAVLNSRLGRQAQDRVVEGIGRAVHQFHLHVLTGLVGCAGGEVGAGRGLVGGRCRGSVLRHAAHRATAQSDQALSRGHGVAQAARADDSRGRRSACGRDRDGEGAGADAGNVRFHLHPRRVRVSGLGAQGELAAVCGQPGGDAAAGAGRAPRRDDPTPAPPRLPLGHDPETVRQAAARSGIGPRLRPAAGRAGGASPARPGGGGRRVHRARVPRARASGGGVRGDGVAGGRRLAGGQSDRGRRGGRRYRVGPARADVQPPKR